MKLFVYGSLKKVNVREEVLGEKLKDEHPHAHLLGYREMHEKVKGKSEKYPTLNKDPNSSVNGEVYDVTEDELKKLDSYEDTYKRVPVKLSDGEQVETYVRQG